MRSRLVSVNLADFTVNVRVLLFTLTISLLTAGIFGIARAFQASRADLNLILKDGARGSVGSRRSRARNLLAISEVSLAMVLLIGAGLLINSMHRMGRVSPGFDTSNLLTMTVHLPEAEKYVERVPGGDMERATPQVSFFFQQLLDRVSAIPGVVSAGSITRLPMRFSGGYTFSILGAAPPPLDRRPGSGYAQMSSNLFHTLGIPLKRGRLLDEHDTASAPWAIVVNEAFARRFFPDGDAIGKQIRLRFDPYPTEEDRPRQIVGVVGDVKQHGLGRPAPPFIYASILQQGAVYPGGSIVMHLWQDLAMRLAPNTRIEDVVKATREIVAQLDPDQPIENVMMMDRVFEASMGNTRMYMQLLSVFGGVAAFLAAIGIYGVMSYFVSQHTHEIGVRMAVGARRENIFRWVGLLGTKIVLAGIAVGVGLAIGLTRFIASSLFGITATDPATYVAVAIMLAGIALIACYIPMRRATKVDPLVALRYE